MERLVVDTDVASYIFKKDTRGAQYEPYLLNKELVLSFSSLTEMKWWALRRNWGEKKQQQLHQYLDKQFLFYFCDETLCSIWAEVFEFSTRQGRTMAVFDAWVAATALLLNSPLVTNNRKHYDHIPNLEIISLS